MPPTPNTKSNPLSSEAQTGFVLKMFLVKLNGDFWLNSDWRGRRETPDANGKEASEAPAEINRLN
jgi:hypothetical protein